MRAFVPHIDQEPAELIVEGRTDPTRHAGADYRVEPLKLKGGRPAPKVPVAGMPHVKGERRAVFRGKSRPVLVLSVGGVDVPKALVASSARWLTAKTWIVAPYFGVDQDGSRGGWPPGLVERIRHAEYPQYVWDSLPLSDVRESILRLDQLQAIGRSEAATESLSFRLHPNAMAMIDEWLTWLLQGGLPADGFLHEIRQNLVGAVAL